MAANPEFPDLLQLGIVHRPMQLIGVALQQLRRRLYSDEIDYGFVFDLLKPFEVPNPRLPVRIRELRPSDITQLFNFRQGSYDTEGLRESLQCLAFIKSGIPTCYVGVTTEDIPCVMNWLIRPSENQRLHNYFGGGIQPLKPDEALCEFVYTHPDYRGNRMMPWITQSLWEIARDEGFQKVIALVHGSNAVSLKLTPRMGWKPSFKKTVRWRLLNRTIKFETIGQSSADVGRVEVGDPVFE